MKLIFQGKVELGDECRCDDMEPEGAILIGGRDVIQEIYDADFQRQVTVGICDERFDGPLSVDTGWGYSEYTPMDEDLLRVGDHDLIDILSRYEGREITLFVADEPVNLLEREP